MERGEGTPLHVFFELGDHLGSTSVVLDKATGELVERSTYQAYGGTESDYRPERWKSFREDYRFTGKEEDVEVGLIYFGYRFLNPLLNRWVSADPLAIHGLGADPNLYAYVSGRVLQAVDPLGLCAADDGSGGCSGESSEMEATPESGASGTGNSTAQGGRDYAYGPSARWSPSFAPRTTTSAEPEPESAPGEGAGGTGPTDAELLRQLEAILVGIQEWELKDGKTSGPRVDLVVPRSDSQQAELVRQANGGAEGAGTTEAPVSPPDPARYVGTATPDVDTTPTETGVPQRGVARAVAKGLRPRVPTALSKGGNALRKPGPVRRKPHARRTSGETDATIRGKAAHKAWTPPSGYTKEYRLPSGRQVDAINHRTRHILELKPNNPRKIREGMRQVQRYVKEMEDLTGQGWTGSVVTY